MLTRARAHTHTATHATYTKTSTRRRVIKSAHSHVRPHSTTVVASSARGESVVMELPHTSSSLSASFGCASVRWMRGRGSKERERERAERRQGRGWKVSDVRTRVQAGPPSPLNTFASRGGGAERGHTTTEQLTLPASICANVRRSATML